jgi:plasmid stability protein
VATIVVEGMPDGLLARLRLAAAGSGRSLSREVVVQLARSVRCARRDAGEDASRVGSRCAEGRGCHCAARPVQARAVGWGGPAR